MTTARLDAPATAPSSVAEMDYYPFWRLSVEQYHAMIENGILANQPMELLDGFLVQKMAKSPPHCLATQLLLEALQAPLPVLWFARSQDPITLSESETEPDITVVRGHPRDYAHRHPGPANLGFVVEVSDSSIHRDRKLKQILYSQNGVAQNWIFNLENRTLEIFTQPASVKHQEYGHSRVYGPDDRLSVVLEGVIIGEIPVREILPA